MTPLKRWFPIIVLGLLSCTIVEEGDITTPTEASSLSLTSLTISQKTAKGNSTLEIKRLYDSVQNFTDATTNTKITRKIGYSIPVVGNFKLKLRSASTQATSIHITYTDFKKPYTAYILEKDSIIEIYRFRYNTAKQLNRIITIINKVDNLPPTVRTNDTLIYSGSRIATLTRRIGGVNTSYNMFYRSSDSDYWVSSLSVAGGTGNNNIFEQSQTSGGGGCSTPSCDPYRKTNVNGTPNILISGFNVGTAVVDLYLRDQRSPSGNGQIQRESDIYYFHPLMVLFGQHTDGENLLAIYLLDWWVAGAASSSGPTSEENVSFTYKYGL